MLSNDKFSIQLIFFIISTICVLMEVVLCHNFEWLELVVTICKIMFHKKTLVMSSIINERIAV